MSTSPRIEEVKWISLAKSSCRDLHISLGYRTPNMGTMRMDYELKAAGEACGSRCMAWN